MGARLRLSPAEVDEVWSRWRSGQAIRALSREMRVNHSVVRDLIYGCGGIRPSPRRRCEVRLSVTEREEISRGLAAGSRRVNLHDYSQTDLDAIADRLNGRPRQTLGYRTPSQALDEALR